MDFTGEIPAAQVMSSTWTNTGRTLMKSGYGVLQGVNMELSGVPQEFNTRVTPGRTLMELLAVFIRGVCIVFS